MLFYSKTSKLQMFLLQKTTKKHFKEKAAHVDIPYSNPQSATNDFDN